MREITTPSTLKRGSYFRSPPQRHLPRVGGGGARKLFMKTNYGLSLIVLALLAIIPRLAAADLVLEVALTANDQMKFNLTEITARPGQTVHVTFTNAGTMPKMVMGHNWVLLKAGQDPVAYSNAAVSAASENYQPKALADRVIAAIPLLGPKQTAETTFAAPVTAGIYYYLCSFPAHTQAGMRGKLTVQ